jgi:hypothetical protein
MSAIHDTRSSMDPQDGTAWAKIALAWLGNWLAYLADHEHELQAILLVLTILWTLWQWGASIIDRMRQSEAHRKLLDKIGAMRTKPTPLDEEPKR